MHTHTGLYRFLFLFLFFLCFSTTPHSCIAQQSILKWMFAILRAWAITLVRVHPSTPTDNRSTPHPHPHTLKQPLPPCSLHATFGTRSSRLFHSLSTKISPIFESSLSSLLHWCRGWQYWIAISILFYFCCLFLDAVIANRKDPHAEQSSSNIRRRQKKRSPIIIPLSQLILFWRQGHDGVRMRESKWRVTRMTKDRWQRRWIESRGRTVSNRDGHGCGHCYGQGYKHTEHGLPFLWGLNGGLLSPRKGHKKKVNCLCGCKWLQGTQSSCSLVQNTRPCPSSPLSSLLCMDTKAKWVINGMSLGRRQRIIGWMSLFQLAPGRVFSLFCRVYECIPRLASLSFSVLAPVLFFLLLRFVTFPPTSDTQAYQSSTSCPNHQCLLSHKYASISSEPRYERTQTLSPNQFTLILGQNTRGKLAIAPNA